VSHNYLIVDLTWGGNSNWVLHVAGAAVRIAKCQCVLQRNVETIYRICSASDSTRAS